MEVRDDEDDNNDDAVIEHHSFCSRPRLLYASIFCWISVCGGRFLALFLEDVGGLSITQIGFTLALQQVLSTAFASIGCSWADALERQNPDLGRAFILGLSVVLGTCCFLFHPLVSSPSVHIILQALYAIATALTSPVLDGITIHHLQNRADYGKERLFGAVSWAVTNLVLSIMLDHFGFAVMYPLALVACAFVLLSLLVYVANQPPNVKNFTALKSVSCKIAASPCAAESDNRVEVTTESEQLWSAEIEPSDSAFSLLTLLRLILVSSPALAFIFCVFCLAVGQVLVDSMIFLLFEDLGSSYTIMGCTVVLTVLFEIPIFQVAPYFLEAYGSSALLLMAGFCYVTRVLFYTFVPNGHILYVLLVEPLHGITYACSQTAYVDFVARNQILPRGYEASAQGLLQLFKGSGSASGLLVGGWVEESAGPRVLYRVAAGVVAVGSVAFAIAMGLESRQCNGHELVPTGDDGNLELSDTHPMAGTGSNSKE